MLSSVVDLKLLVVSIPVAFWMGFFIDRWFRQATIYHLLGRAAKIDVSAKYAERCAKETSRKKDWIILSSAMSLTFFDIGVMVRSETHFIFVIGIAIIAAILFGWFAVRSIASYNAAFARLEKRANRHLAKAPDGL